MQTQVSNKKKYSQRALFLSNLTCLSLACLADGVSLIALLTVTLVAARQVDADLTACVRHITFINVWR